VIFGGTWLASLPDGVGSPWEARCGVSIGNDDLDCVSSVGLLSAWLFTLSR
jgi:hypothetical protein